MKRHPVSERTGSEAGVGPGSQAGREGRLGPASRPPLNAVHPEVSLHVKLGDLIVRGSCESSDLRGCMLNTFAEVTPRIGTKTKKKRGVNMYYSLT